MYTVYTCIPSMLGQAQAAEASFIARAPYKYEYATVPLALDAAGWLEL